MSRTPLCFVLAAASLALSCLATASPARAQPCSTDRSQPVVCSTELAVIRPGERWGDVFTGSVLTLPARSTIELQARPADQWGRRFPEERFRFVLDLDRDCDDLLSVSEVNEVTLRIETGIHEGNCDALVWVPNDLNLDRRIRFEVERSKSRSYSRAESEVMARALYRAILGRDPDPEGLRGATLEIQKGDLEDQVSSMLRSPEFQSQRAHLSAGELLESFYQGILGRQADTSGVRTYFRRVERRDYAGVVLDLIRSEEFEERMLQGAR
jgi:hypothetical protein